MSTRYINSITNSKTFILDCGSSLYKEQEMSGDDIAEQGQDKDVDIVQAVVLEDVSTA